MTLDAPWVASTSEPSSADSALPSWGVGVVASVVAVLCIALIIVFVLFRRRVRQKTRMERAMVQKMDELESRVADVCKMGFAELQSGGTLAMTTSQAKPLSFDEFVTRTLFTYTDTHPVPLRVTPGMEEAVEDFDRLLMNESFVQMMVQSLEGQGKSFSIRDRCHVAALLSVSLQHKPE